MKIAINTGVTGADYGKADSEFGWTPKVSLVKLNQNMAKAGLKWSESGVPF